MVRLLRRFAADQSGNFAIISAIMMPVLLVAMGGAVDVTQAYRMGTRLQGAVDAAALAAGRLPKDRHHEANAVAQAYFTANFETPVNIDLKIVDGSKFVVTGEIPVKTAFLQLIRMNEIPVRRTSEVTMATNTREIAFVLDTTGSMSTGRRMPDMKTAVNRIVDELAEAGKQQGTDTKFSVVPFSSFVNVMPENNRVPDFVDATGAANPPMSDFPAGLSRLDLYQHVGQSWRGCVESRRGGHDILNTPANRSRPETMFVPAFAADEPDPRRGLFGITLSPHYPNDYLSDNDGSTRLYDLSNNYAYHGRSSPTGTLLGDVLRLGASGNNGRFGADHHPLARYGVTFTTNGDVRPRSNWNRVSTKRAYRFYSNQTDDQGPNFGCEVDPIMPLTTQTSRVKSKVTALQARGSTNIPEGLAWGWRTLSPGGPYTEGRSFDDQENDKVLVLLTDGANDITMLNSVSGYEKGSAYSSYGYLWDGYLRRRNGQIARSAADMKEAMNDRVLELCTNIKRSGVKIFTILLEVDDAATSSMLSRCASSPDQFYDARNSSRLEDVFEDIKGRISRLRISR